MKYIYICLFHWWVFVVCDLPLFGSGTDMPGYWKGLLCWLVLVCRFLSGSFVLFLFKSSLDATRAAAVGECESSKESHVEAHNSNNTLHAEAALRPREAFAEGQLTKQAIAVGPQAAAASLLLLHFSLQAGHCRGPQGRFCSGLCPPGLASRF